MSNEKLQKIYYIIGIIQRIIMIILTFCMMGLFYKIYELSIQYGIQINKIPELIEKLYKLLDRSWFF
jgi:hypothetical protein